VRRVVEKLIPVLILPKGAAMNLTSQNLNLWERAALTRRQARATLRSRSHGKGHRMILVLSLVIILVVGVALYMAVGCLATAGYILFGEAQWVDAAAAALTVLLLLGLLLPLCGSVFRLACLMTIPEEDSTEGLPVWLPEVTLSELFYPFTSLRAYGRVMVVVMESLGFTALSVGLPILLFRLALLTLTSLAGSSPVLFGLLAVAAFIVCFSLGFLFFFLSGRRAGFGYFVFVHDWMPLGEVNRYFRGFRRSFTAVFCLRISLAGWYAVSVAGMLVPLLLHVAPYSLCSAAAYARSLKRL
jgi:hypothetical protein